MDTVTKRQLNQATAASLAMVTEGNDVIVTENGVPRWRISAYRHEQTVLERLEAEGVYRPPLRPFPSDLPEPTGREYTLEEVDALIAEMKGDR